MTPLPVQLETPCITWTGYIQPNGYGYDSTHNQMAHRTAYKAAFGPIPDGLTVDHRCFNPPCVNPEHLQLKTWSQNRLDQRPPTNPTCKNGHPYTDENTYLEPSQSPVLTDRTIRRCRQCWRDNQQRAQARRRQGIPASPAFGENHYAAKLTVAQWEQLFAELTGGASRRSLAIRYGVTAATIVKALQRQAEGRLR